MSDSHILNVNVPASKLLNGGVLEYPDGENSFQFNIIDAIKDDHFEIKTVAFSNNAVVMLPRLKARLKAETNPITGKRTSCNMSISPNSHNLRAMKIDHMKGEQCFLVTATNRGTFIVHTGNNFPALGNKDEVACITTNLKKVNDAFEMNELFETIP
jgi:hypothetical protein